MKVIEGNLIVGDKKIPVDLEEYMNVDNEFGVSVHDLKGVSSSQFPSDVRLRLGFYPERDLIPWLHLQKVKDNLVAYVEILCDYHDWNLEQSIEETFEIVEHRIKLKLDVAESQIEPDLDVGKYFLWLKLRIASDDIAKSLMKMLNVIGSEYRVALLDPVERYTSGPIKLDSWSFGPVRINVGEIIGSILPKIRKLLTNMSKGRS